MVVRHITGEGGESEEGVHGQGDVVELEARFPMIPLMVVDLKLGVYILNMDEFALCCHLCIAIVDAAASNFLTSTILVVLIRLYTVAVHDGYSWEGVRMPRVGVGVEKNAETGKVVDAAKYGPWFGTILSEPDSQPITGNVRSVTFDFEFECDLEIVCGERETGPEPAHLGATILGETNVSVGIYDGVSAKVPELVLKIGIDIGCIDAVGA